MIRQATRRKAKIRLGLSAVSGGGKTYSALLIAQGLTGDLTKVCIVDTENGSADLYAHLGGYNVVTLTDFSPEAYIAALKECADAGMECVIVDSITHEWEWCLQMQERLGGKYQDWAKVTPRHDAFKNAMLQSPCHIITTVRRKQDYDMTKNSNGKVVVEKAGLKEVTRDGWEYELTINLELDMRHLARAGKDRTGLFMDKPEFVPSVETGRMIKDWCERGEDAPVPSSENAGMLTDALSAVRKAACIADLTALWNSCQALQSSKTFVEAMSRRKKEILQAAPAKEMQPVASQTAMTKEEFKLRWESTKDGGGITYEDCAECAKAWGISHTPRIRPMNEILYAVLRAAGVRDCEDYNPASQSDDDDDDDAIDSAQVRRESKMEEYGLSKANFSS